MQITVLVEKLSWFNVTIQEQHTTLADLEPEKGG